MFHRILIPTDFSTASEWVFDDAVRIAGASGAELLILHVRMTWASSPDELRFPADPKLYEYAEQQELERLRDRIRRANANLTTRLIVRQAPHAGAEIGRTATQEGVDLIVIATHARHHVAHLFVGSTTMSVLKEPPAPVLAIRYGIRKRASLARVIVPVHLHQTSHRALELAAREAKETHLVTVCSEDDHAKAEEMLRGLAANVPGGTIAIIRGKDPEEEIVRYTTRVDADAIFLNAAAAPSERKLDIVRHATVPVMVV
jgi:nucleotide-binding universal stress UspA family protein